MKRNKKQNRAVVALALAAALLILTGLATGESAVSAFLTNLGAGGGTTAITVGNAVETQEGGASVQQANHVDLNDVDNGRAFNADGSNNTNTTMSNYTFINSNGCGAGCVPSQGNCTQVNVSLTRNNASLTVVQRKTICTGQGYPVHLTGGAFYYNYFKTVLTTEDSVSVTSYVVNVTATNGTKVGRNSTAVPASGQVYLDVWLTEGMSGVPPQWHDNQSVIAYMYDPANVSNFTIKWTDNNYMNTVLLESNFSGSPQNYSMTNFTPDYYSYLNVLPAGTFYWKSYGSDAEPNWNVSDTWYFTVAQSDRNTVNLWLNGTPNQNIGITYGMQSIANATAVAGPKLYRNDTYVGTNETAVLPAGVYEYKANASGNANYSANDTGVTRYLTVSQAAPALNVEFSPSDSVTYGTQTTVTCTQITGDSGANLTLLRNGTEVNSSISGTAAQTDVLGGGGYNYSCTYNGTRNYTAGANITNYLTVNRASMPVTLLLNGTDGNRSYLNTTAANFTITTQVSGLQVILYTNYSDGTNKRWDNGTSPFTNVTTFIAAGTWNFTAHFEGNQNYTANSTTRYATVPAKSPTSITLYFNGTSTTSFQTGSVINVTAVLNVAGKPIYLDINRTNWTTQNGTTYVTNVSQYSTDGVYNVTAWFPGDADYESSSATSYLTISAAPTPTPSPAPGGGGGAPMIVPMAPAKPTYSVSNAKDWYSHGDTIGLIYEIKNPSFSMTDVTVSTTVTADGKVFWKYDETVRVGANETYRWERKVSDISCTTPPGPHEVKVEWTHNATLEKTDKLTYVVYYACKALKLTVVSEKPVYFTNDTAFLTVTAENIGTVAVDEATVKEVLTGPNGTAMYVFMRELSLKPGQKDVSTSNVTLTDFEPGIYMYKADVLEGGASLASASTMFIIVVPVNVMYYAIPSLLLALLLAALWLRVRPLSLRKMVVPPVKTSKVLFILKNRTSHAFKNVVITDRVPPDVAILEIDPKPAIRKKLQNGSIRLEWHLKCVMPRERKELYYILSKKKRVLPKARIRNFERDKVLEELYAKKKELAKAEQTIMTKLRGDAKAARKT